MKPRKSKSGEPSLRDKLSEAYLKAFESDFAANGMAAIKSLRQKSPEKYAEIASRLIASSEPLPPGDFGQCKSLEDIGRKLLEQVGCLDPSDDQVKLAVEANDAFVARLSEIAADEINPLALVEVA